MKKSLIALLLGLVSTSGHAVPGQGNAIDDQQTIARCELSNGVKMALDYSAVTKGRGNPEGTPMDFVTSANVVGVRGTIIPVGLYKVNIIHDSNKWALVMKQVADDGITPPKSSSP